MKLAENKYYQKTISFFALIERHNIFLLASSLSYYTALALAPFVLILFYITSLIGADAQQRIVRQVSFTISPQVGEVAKMVLDNTKEVDISSWTGIIGGAVVLFTVSVVFIQLRYSFDLIFNFYNPERSRSLWEIIKERLLSMVYVVGFSITFTVALFFTSFMWFFVKEREEVTILLTITLIAVNFFIFLLLFLVLYYFVPSKRIPRPARVRAALYATVGFILGKEFIGFYFKEFVPGSVYGAAGALILFLVWVYYSALMLFFSAELANFVTDYHIRKKAKKLSVAKAASENSEETIS